MSRLIVLLACLLIASLVSASVDTDRLLVDALAQRLHQDPQWLALLHVNRGGTLRDRDRSYVDDPAFFLAPDGADDPAAELQASIRALFAEDAGGRCRYVARYRWLAKRLGIDADDLLASCADYAAWRKAMVADRVVLVFPGSYLNSPSSMFGHTLLRIDPLPGEGDTVWLSQAVSFGAEVRAGDNSMLYIWRGLAGGYPGRFQVEQYFRKIQQYGRMENRDLWEYPLDLTPEETAFMVDHLWELQNINFDYYFFDENCSYRLLELLEVARPSLRLTNDWRLSEAPVNTIRATSDAGLAASPTLRPSAERELRARVDDLSAAERRLALALARDEGVMAGEQFGSLPADRQSAVLASAYARLVYRARKAVGRDPVRAQRSLALLRGLNERGSNPRVAVPSPLPPESGHRTRRVSIGGGGSVVGESGVDPSGFAVLGFRPTYHDFLDPPAGYLPGAELEILDTELRVDDGVLKLERLDIANVFSLSPRNEFFPNWSWRVRGAIERQLQPDARVRSTRLLEGGGGVAVGEGPVLWRAYAEARAEHSGAHEHNLDVGFGPALGVLGQHSRLAWQIDVRPLYFTGGFRRTEARAAGQWHLSGDWGLRAELRWRRGGTSASDMEVTDGLVQLHRYF